MAALTVFRRRRRAYFGKNAHRPTQNCDGEQAVEEGFKVVERPSTEPQSTRRAPRLPLVVDVEVTNLKSGIQIKERTRDLSLFGCGVSATSLHFSAGTEVTLKLAYGGTEIVAFGRVIYARPDIGMGVAFTFIGPDDQKLLEAWLAD